MNRTTKKKDLGTEIFGKVEVDLLEVGVEVTHDMWLPLEDGNSTIHFLLTINAETSGHRKEIEKSEINVDILKIEYVTHINNEISGTMYSHADAGYQECGIHCH